MADNVNLKRNLYLRNTSSMGGEPLSTYSGFSSKQHRKRHQVGNNTTSWGMQISSKVLTSVWAWVLATCMQRRRLQLEIALPSLVPACGVVILGAWAFLRSKRLGRATFKNDSKARFRSLVHFQVEKLRLIGNEKAILGTPDSRALNER